KSQAPWVHVTLELGAGHDVSEVDVSSLRILGAAPVGKSARIGDVDLDGISDLTVAFPRDPFDQLAPGKHVVTLTGAVVSGGAFQDQAPIRVLETHGRVTARVVSPVGAFPVVLEISQATGRERSVKIFDVGGRLVRSWNERDAHGARVIWDGRTAK